MFAHTSCLLVAPLLLVSQGQPGQSWIVDDDGGPGVDFTDLPTAVHSPLVADGDTLLLQPGVYDTLQLTRPLTILGQGAEPADVQLAFIQTPGEDYIQGVDGPVTLANLKVGAMDVLDCSGPVTLAHMISGFTEVEGSSQVRMQDVWASSLGLSRVLRVVNSAVEVSSCEFTNAVTASGGAYLRMARTPTKGDPGEDADAWSGATDGSPAVRVLDAEVHLVGDGQLLRGGAGGVGTSCSNNGEPAPALLLEDDAQPGSIRHSGYDLQGGFFPDLWCSSDPQADPVVVEAGTFFEPSTPDPILRLEGLPRPGETIELIANAEGASMTLLFAGFTPLSLELPGFVGRLAVTPDLLLESGPGPGPLVASIELLATAPLGVVAHAQAVSLYPGGESKRFSNPVALVVH